MIVDADMGVLNDDAVALFMLLNTPNIEVLGVTIVPGNSWMENGTAAALRQLELIGRTDVPVFMGVREPLMGSRQPWLEAEERLWGRPNTWAPTRGRVPSRTWRSTASR